MDKLERAILCAAINHRGQQDKGGEPYILHVLSVMFRVRIAGESETAQIVALLHDVVEANAMTHGDIKEDFGRDVAESVDALTRVKGETYKQYILRVREDPIARAVKLADLRDNLDPKRKAIEEGSSLQRRYKDAVAALIRGAPTAEGEALSSPPWS